MRDDKRETVYKFTPEAKPGWPCPRCHGCGHNMDGGGSFGTNADGSKEIRIQHPTKCYLCNGKGRVNVTPID